MNNAIPTRSLVQMWVCALMIIAAYIRVHGADVYHYSADEAEEVYIASARSLTEVIRFALEGALHSPLGYVLRHFWLQLSAGPGFVRGLSLLFGLALIPLYYRIGKILNGPLTGMCAAWLAAFSYGCIVQSYLVRNYTLDLFLISLCLCCYFEWRVTRSTQALMGYVAAGLLAFLSSFSGVFALLTMVGSETLLLRRRKSDAPVLRNWVLTNLLIGGACLAFYLWWRQAAPAFIPLQAFLHSMLPPSLPLYAPLYPQMVLGYFLLHLTNSFAAFCQLLAAMGLMLFAVKRNPQVRFPLLVCVAGLLVGTLLFATGIFPFLGSRHSLWLLPFVIVALACGLAEAIRAAVQVWGARALPLALALLLAAGWGAYVLNDRFGDTEEYALTNEEWQDLTDFLDALDGSHLLLLGRGDVYALDVPEYNPYRYSDNPLFQKTGHLAEVPYHHLNILYDPLRFDTHPLNANLTRLPEAAQSLDLLKGVSMLVFLVTSETAPSSAPLLALMTCPELGKSVVTFPPSPPGHIFTREELLAAPVTLMIVPKRAFFDQAVAASGKAHYCLN